MGSQSASTKLAYSSSDHIMILSPRSETFTDGRRAIQNSHLLLSE